MTCLIEYEQAPGIRPFSVNAWYIKCSVCCKPIPMLTGHIYKDKVDKFCNCDEPTSDGKIYIHQCV